MTTPRTAAGPIAPHGLPSPDARFLWDADGRRWEPRESWQPRIEAEAAAPALDVDILAKAINDAAVWDMDEFCIDAPLSVEQAEKIAAEYARLSADEEGDGLTDREAAEYGVLDHQSVQP